MELSPNLVEGRFLVRLNRFAALVEVPDQEVVVHVANSGRMRELLVPGHRVLLKPIGGNHRKSHFDLALVDLGSKLVSADARLPNALVAEALEKGALAQFQGYAQRHREVTFAGSRLDLMLEGPGGFCYIETKSVTLVVDRVAMFPDAPTIRGVKHLDSLTQAVAQGNRAAVIFVVQRDDAQAFATNDAADPRFGAAFRRALAAGVEAHAYRCWVTEQEIKLADPLSVSATGELPSLLLEVYQRLYRRYGPQGWWPGDGPLDVVVGAILTQAAAWTNVELAIRNLKQAGCWSLEAIYRRPETELANIIRPSGFFNAKARKLKAFASHIIQHYRGDLELFLSKETDQLRAELLSIHGIGPETADDILLYAAGKPSFVIDAYTRRILQRLGIAPAGRQDNYQLYQALFHDNLPPDAALFNEYHALLDRHAKEACAKVPRCLGCCLREICAAGRAYQDG